MRTGGELFVDCLIENGVDFFTCVPGESFLPVLDALYDATRGEGGVRLITTRHEAAAANMVEAAGKLTGRPSVCLVTRGPGATHASIAVHTAFQDGTPMILAVGQIARDMKGRQAFQEVDYGALLGSQAKLVVEITDVDRIPEIVAHAVDVATAGRPGPVVLALPEDMLFEQSEARPVRSPARFGHTASPADVAHIAEVIAAAERPLLLVGGPKWSGEAGERVRAFAERNDVPVAAAFRYQDAIDNRSESYVGYLGLSCSPELRARAQEADLIVALGCRLDDPTTDGFALTPVGRTDHRIVVVTEDALEVTAALIPDEAVLCTSESLAEGLAGVELAPSASRSEWLGRLRGIQERFVVPPPVEGPIDLGRVVGMLRERVGDDAILTNGAGNYTIWLQRFFQFRSWGTQLAPHNGAMGYGFPAALAAAALRPDSPVIAFAGDGCFLMAGSELATAVKERLNVVILVLNNGVLGTIRMHQENHYPGRQVATDLLDPDFVRYAEAFGALGLRVTTTDEFPAALDAALAYDGPALVELRTDPFQLTPDRRITGVGDAKETPR